jgi:hypothetical protein
VPLGANLGRIAPEPRSRILGLSVQV